MQTDFIVVVLLVSSLKRHFPLSFQFIFTFILAADLLRTIYWLQAAADRSPVCLLLFRVAPSLPPILCRASARVYSLYTCAEIA